MVIGIRGNAPTDASEVTRDGAVGIYVDGVYLARSHSVSLDVADLERIEVLRGPQGSIVWSQLNWWCYKYGVEKADRSMGC